MKKIIFPFFVLLLLCGSALALIDFKGVGLPYLVYGQVTLNQEVVGGVKLTITNERTGFTKNIVTNDEGYWQEDAMNWKTTSAFTPPIAEGDMIKVVVKGDCAEGEICEKSVSAFSEGLGGLEINFSFEKTQFPYLKTIGFIITGLIIIIAALFAKKYMWGNGFIGLVKYWARKDPRRALKMLETALNKEKQGKYKK